MHALFWYMKLTLQLLLALDIIQVLVLINSAHPRIYNNCHDYNSHV